MPADRNLLAAAVAFRAGLIDPERLAQVCALWVDSPDRSILDLLAERGWIDEKQRVQLEEDMLDASANVDETRPRAVGAVRPVAVAKATEDTAGLSGGVLTEADGPAALGTGQDETIDHRTERATNGDLDHSEATVDLGQRAGHVLLSTVVNTAETRTHYTRSKLHAKGGMGQVWLARDLDLDREVALKELRPEQAGNVVTRERFLAEARITGQLEHPGIVPVYELVAGDGRSGPYYTMRMVRGRTLNAAIAEYQKRRQAGTADGLELTRLLNAFQAVCRAIAYAHSRRFIHRDLKGQNIVLGDFGEVMVLDWGLAKSLDGPEIVTEATPSWSGDDGPLTRTVHGQVMGTPAYMSPEQAEGALDRVGTHSDVYGLGAVLFEVLTGRAPFTGQTSKELLRKVREERPVPPRTLDPRIPAALEAICLKAMAKDPAMRYESATALADDVERWLADEPVVAYPEPPTARVARWARRHRSTVTALAGVAGIALIALTGGYVLVRRERDEAVRQRAEAQRQRAFARQAADDMYGEFGQYWLEDFLDPVQKATLEKARDAFTRFDQEQAGEPNAARQRGRANARLATIAQKLGDLEAAEQAFTTAEALLKAQAQGPDAQPADHLEWAGARIDHARLKARVGKLDEAAASLSDIFADLVKVEGSGPEARYQAGRAAMALAEAHRVAGRPADAESAFEEAARRFRDLASTRDAGFEVRRDLAATLEGQGVARLDQDRPDIAESSLNEAIDVAQPLLVQFPTVAIVRDVLARSQITLGRVREAKKDASKARAAYLAGAAQYQRLSEDFPLRPEYRRGLARAHLNLGNLVFKGDGQDAEAEREYRQGVAIHEALEQPAHDFKYQRDLARAYTNLGTLATRQGRFDEAARFFEKSSTLLSGLVAEYPEVPELAASLAVLAMNRGDLEGARGEAPAAIAHYDQAIAAYQTLIERNPGVARYRREQAQTYNNLALAHKSTGAIAEAAGALQRALAIYDDEYRKTKQAGYLPLMAGGHTNLGELRLPDAEREYRRSLDVFREVVQANPKSSRYQADLSIALLNLGSYLDEKKSDEADTLFAEAAGRLENVVAAQPEGHRARYLLGNVLGRQAQRSWNKDPARAGALLSTAIYHGQRAVDEAPGVLGYREDLLKHMEALAMLRLSSGDHEGAAALATTMTQVAPDDPSAALRATRLLAKAARQAAEAPGRSAEERSRRGDELRTQAAELLKRTHADARSIEEDPDLRELRPRP